MKTSKVELDWQIENGYFQKGYSIICGTDEAGRGPLFGPVVAAACILPMNFTIPFLNDSKKLSEKRREELYDIIVENAVSYSISSISAEKIDEINILNASLLAMKNAVLNLETQPNIVLVDGNIARGFPCEAVAIIKGDSRCPNIAAASILAKVTRDKMCYEYDKIYPQYGLTKHKGYPTKAHMEAIRNYGATIEHRKSFLGFLDK